MSEQFRIQPTTTFTNDVVRLEGYIVERELASNTPDEDCLVRFQAAMERVLGILELAPFTCRRCEANPTFRELLVPFGHSGCVVLFAIRGPDVLLLAARHQYERDFK